MWVLLETEDVFLFRDSRPFTAGEDFRAEGQFPPLPPPVAGAVRSILLTSALRKEGKGFRDLESDPLLASVRAALGTADSMGQLRLAGPLACRYVPGQFLPEPLFALPADALPRGIPRLRDDLTTPGLRRSMTGVLGGSMAVLDPALASVTEAEEEEAEPVGDWLCAGEMEKYLTGAAQITRECLKVLTETRTGIHRNERRTVEAGWFFNAQMQRPHWDQHSAIGLLLRLETPTGHAIETPQYVPLGGEGRSAFLRPLHNLSLPLDGLQVRHGIAEQIAADEGRFRLYLATPGVFGGATPGEGGLLPSAFPGTLKGVASGKAVPVGGWSLATNSPRPLRRAAPAGTVYFGQLADCTLDAAKTLVETFHHRTTLQEQDHLPEAEYRARMGFGLTLVGAWTAPVRTQIRENI